MGGESKRGTRWLTGVARCEGTPVAAVEVSGGVCAASCMVCECLGSGFSLNSHAELLINQHPQVLLRAALHPFSTQPGFELGMAPTRVQDLALGLVELQEVRMGPPLQPAQVPLDGSPSLQPVDRTTQLGVIGKLAEGASIPLSM